MELMSFRTAVLLLPSVLIVFVSLDPPRTIGLFPMDVTSFKVGRMHLSELFLPFAIILTPKSPQKRIGVFIIFPT